MPEKRYKKGCGPSCIGCWVNNLKHGNPQAKEYLKKHGLTKIEIIHDKDKENNFSEKEARI